MFRTMCLLAAALCCGLSGVSADAAVTVFFDPSQRATRVAEGATSDTVYSNGYLFTCTRDKLFTGGTGHVIGRQIRIPWPDGVEAQAVTAGPLTSGARLTIKRADGDVFDLTSFTARLLANTAGAGGSIEIMPILDGEDALNDPVFFFASGYSWSSFYYDANTPAYLGNTAALKGYEAYKVSLYVDFAFTSLTLDSPAVPGDFDLDRDVDATDLGAFKPCISGPSVPLRAGCEGKDLDFDNDVDQEDFGIFQHCYTGPNLPGDPNCS